MDVLEWLLEGDPAIRWQVMRDLTHEPAEVVAAERARVATQGWGARLLALQQPDGTWAGKAWSNERTDTFHVLDLLRIMGLDPGSEHARRAIDLVREHVRFESGYPGESWDGNPFFAGEVEPCINGRVVAIGSYFGQDVRPLVERLLGERLSDGGWNCEAENGAVVSSLATTIDVLEGLLEAERAAGPTGAPDVTAARRRGEEYLLDRRLFRRLSTGEIIDPDWLRFSFPTYWFYDVLRALDYLRATGAPPDPRVAEADEVVKGKRTADGRWVLENTHRGDVPFALEDGDGRPSRWNTLRAVRVVAWYEQRG